jgi:hypothetical protein
MRCPNCGHEHEERKYLMATESEGPSFFEMLRGDAEPWQVGLSRAGGLLLLFVTLTGLLALS